MKPHPSRCNHAIPKELVIFLKGLSFSAFSKVAARKKTIFIAIKASPGTGGSCAIREQAVVSLPPFAWKRSPFLASGCTTSLMGEDCSFFTFSRDTAKKKNVLAARKASLSSVEAVWHL